MSRHVLVVRLDNAGDVLLSGPAVRAIRAGGARVHYLCGPQGAAAARLLPGVDAITVHRAPWIDPDPEPVDRGSVQALVDDLARLALDEAVILTSYHQSALPTALLLRLAGIRRIAAISEDYPGSLLDVRHVVDDDVHEVTRARSLAEAAGFRLPRDDDGRLAVTLPPPIEAVRRLWDGDEYLVVHPGASVPARAWDPARAAATVTTLRQDGWRVVVTGGAHERPLTARVAGGDGIDLGGATDLAGLAHVLTRARALVVGNTGPAHLAAAVGTPVVSVYAPTVPAIRWAPWGVPCVLLGDQHIACAGCRSRACPLPGQPCLAGVGPDDVRDALTRLGLVPRPGERATTGGPAVQGCTAPAPGERSLAGLPR